MVSKEDREIQRTASDIINQLSIVLKTALIHDPSNIAVRAAIEKFISLVNPVMESERNIILELIGEFFYVNGTRIRYSLEHLLNFDFLLKEFRKREIGSVIFKDIVGPEDVRVFLKSFIASGFSEAPYETMSEGMAESYNIIIDKLDTVTYVL
jgi:hypothetical protein